MGGSLKYLVLLLSVLLLAPEQSSARSSLIFRDNSTIQLGLELGVNSSAFEYADPENLPLSEDSYTSRLTFRSDVLLGFALAGPLSVRSGVSLDVRGNKIEFDTTITTIEDPWTSIPAHSELLSTLYYLRIPAQAVVFVAQNEVRPYLLAGPEIAFLLKERASFDTRGDGIHVSGSGPPSSSSPGLDFGFDLGVGCEVPVRGVTSLVEVSYFWGLRNLNETSNRDEHRIYNRVASLSIGVWL